MVSRSSFLSLLIGVFACAAAGAQTYPIEWQTQFGTASTERGTGVAVDKAGGVFITGYTYGQLTGSSLGGVDTFVRKFDSSGAELWTRLVGGSGFDSGNSVAIDRHGEVYVSGYSDQGLGPSEQVRDAALTKLSNTGEVLWTRHVGTAYEDVSNAVAVDRFDNVFISGYSTIAAPVGFVGDRDTFLTKFDSSGSVLWTKQLGEDYSDWSNSVQTDLAGNVYISGQSSGGTFLRKFDGNGNSIWTKQFGMDLAWSSSIAVDEYENIYLGGLARGMHGNIDDIVNGILLKLDESGNVLWDRYAGNSIESIALEESGSIFVTGSINDHPFGYTRGTDVFVTKFDAVGDEIWTQELGSNDADLVSSISLDRRGNIYIGGYTEGNLTGYNYRSGDAFLVKFTNPIPEPSAALLCTLGVCCVGIAMRQSLRRRPR